MRDNKWLEGKLNSIWDNHFQDIPKANHLNIYFGRKARRRLGSTREENVNSCYSKTHIRVNGHYKDLSVPDYVIEATIAHEICHYAHGFSSPLPQIYDHPHRGDIVDLEIINRGLGEKLKLQRLWLSQNWNNLVDHPVFK